MRITSSAWGDFVAALYKVDTAATLEMWEYLDRTGWKFGDGTKPLIRAAYAISNKYGEAASALACEMYDAVARAQKAHVPPAEPAPPPTYADAAKAINGTVKTKSIDTIVHSVGRLVKRTGVDTTMQNAIRDGAEWAWVPQGDTCAFCMTLASRGWQRASRAALKGGHAEHIHDNCDCTYAIRFDGKSGVEGYDPDRYLQMYEDADGSNSEDKINAMRRDLYQKNKDKINAQKREAYARRKETEE